MTSNLMTTAAGAVEIETYGSGTPILIIHGSPGGIDAARAMSRFLTESKFRTICVSRPGYLQTPLDPKDHSIDHEADLLAAALDTVGVGQAGVLAWSGGGPAAYRFAVRHPDRVSAMVVIAAVSSQWVAPKANFAEWLIRDTSIGGRLVASLSKRAPERILHEALESEGSVRGEELRIRVQQVMANDEQRQLVLEIARTANTAGKRRAGWRNDLANFASIKSLDLHLVRCPVLLVHGDADTDADPQYSRSAYSELPNSVLVMMKHGTHLSFYAHPEASAVQEQARKWFSDHV